MPGMNWFDQFFKGRSKVFIVCFGRLSICTTIINSKLSWIRSMYKDISLLVATMCFTILRCCSHLSFADCDLRSLSVKWVIEMFQYSVVLTHMQATLQIYCKYILTLRSSLQPWDHYRNLQLPHSMHPLLGGPESLGYFLTFDVCLCLDQQVLHFVRPSLDRASRSTHYSSLALKPGHWKLELRFNAISSVLETMCGIGRHDRLLLTSLKYVIQISIMIVQPQFLVVKVPHWVSITTWPWRRFLVDFHQ